MKSRKLFGLLVIFCFIALALLAPSMANAATDLQGESIYEIMVDRFYDGDTTNNASGAAFRYGETSQDDFRYMHGGDWQGVINKLDYIKNMGYTAIWISPVGDPQLWNMPYNGFQYPCAYHGYNVYDPNVANRYFGNPNPLLSKQKLKELVDAAHAKGIKVIIDVVPNHIGDYVQGTGSSAHYISGGTYQPGTQTQPAAPFNNVGWYHNLGDIDWNNAATFEDHDLGGLDDIDYNNSSAKTAILNSIRDWFTYTGADAARVDAAKCMFPGDIHNIEANSNIASFGEYFDMNVDRIAPYVGSGAEWGMLDFPLFQSMVNGFAYGQNFDDTSTGACSLKNILAQDSKYNGWENHMVTFIDNHDRNRFLTEAGGNVQKLKNALTFLFTVRGVPVVFQGTEVEKGNSDNIYLNGIADTYNRWSMVKKDANGNVITNYFDVSTGTKTLIGSLNQMRQNYQALRTGKQREMWAAPNLYAFSRRVDSGTNVGQEVICIFSNSNGSQTVNMPLRAESTIAVGTTLKNLLNPSETVVVQAGGVTGKQITVTVGANSSKIYATAGSDTTPPTTPTNLTSPSKTSTTISLSWGASSDAGSGLAGYNVYNSSGTQINSAIITGTTYTVTGLAANTTYSFYVKAKDNAGNLSTASNTVTVTTPPSTGNKATIYYKRGFATPYLHYQKPDGTWTTVPGVPMVDAGPTYQGYSVVTDIDMGTNTTLIGCFNDGNGNWDSKNGANYSFPVGTSTFNAGTITAGTPPTSDTTAPSVPANLASPSKTMTTVNLTWSASTDTGGSGLDGYYVFRNGTQVNTSVITATSYTVTGLAPNTTYSFTVKAKDKAGNMSAASSALSVTTPPDTTAPSAPTSLTSPSKTNNSVSLSWTASTDNSGSVAGYIIYRNGVQVNTTLVTGTTFTDTGLAAGTAYSYYVKAKDAAGNISAASNTISVTTNNTTTIKVTFTINNATTVYGQNVYIVGSTPDLGSWSTNSAKGPASCPNYPTWTITLDLVPGEVIQFKAIKKDAAGNVVWEGGSNHTYTVPTSGTGSVTFTWQN